MMIVATAIASCDSSESGGDTPLTDVEIVAADAESIAIGYSGDDNADSVTLNLILPASGDAGSDVVWDSNALAVIAIDGTVTRPAWDTGNATVILTATLTKAEATETITFTLTVIEAPITDDEIVAGDAETLAIEYAPGDSASSVTLDLGLPATATQGSSVSWSSSDTSLITDAGGVTRPSFDAGDTSMTLTATLSQGEASTTVDFPLTLVAVDGFTVSIELSGSYGTVVLQNNSGDDLAVEGDGSYSFANQIGTHYDVSILRAEPFPKSPTLQLCTVENGSAVATDHVTLNVSCELFYFFPSYDVNHNVVIWRTNGTEAGTTVVKTLVDQSGVVPQTMVSMGGAIYFASTDNVHSNELWRTDGTEAGTTMVKDLYLLEEYGSYPRNLTVMNDTLYFTAKVSDELYLWKSDGSESGTVKVFESTFDGLGSLVVADDLLYFEADDGSNGRELWRTDGTAAETFMPLNAAGSDYGDVKDLTALGNEVFWAGVVGDNLNSLRWELMHSDGTIEGTGKFINPNATGHDYPRSIAANNETLYFTAWDGTFSPMQLYVSDGTEEGTSIVSAMTTTDPFGSNTYDLQLVVCDGKAYKMSKDAGDEELWVYDGSTFSLITEINTTGDATPGYMICVSDTLFFQATNGTDGPELWKTNGTETGTTMLKNINLTEAVGSNPLSNSFIRHNVNGVLYFTADDGTHGTELWKTDGTPNGTMMLKDTLEGVESGLDD